MLSISLSLLQLAIPILLGLLVSAYLFEVTQRLLVDLCGTEDRAKFWARCSVITFFATPLILVLLMTDPSRTCESSAVTGCVIPVVRQTLAWTAGGILIAVGMIARSVGRRIPREGAASTPAGSAS